jgi:NAD(P)-dependent dehydrogenase (short-subunit alcohol dehydrogenase family)
MIGRLNGKRALITGAARGIGRACALRFAMEGADIALIDIAQDVATAPYPGARLSQLQEARAAVEGLGRRAIACIADVCDQASLVESIDQVMSACGS